MNATRNPVVAAVADASDEMMAFDQASPNPAPVTTTAEDAQEVAADLRKLIDSAPAHIWLDLGESLEALTDEGSFRDLREVSWSEDNATGVGIKYVRAPVAVATSDAERSAFESTVGKGRDLHRYARGDYTSTYVQNDWDVWQVRATTPVQETAQAGLGAPGRRVASDAEIIAAVRAATPRKPVSDEQIASFLPVWRAFATALAPALQMKAPLTDAARDVLAERQRQISTEGWTPAHDDQYEHGDLASAAACYATQGRYHYPTAGKPGPIWPWPPEWWKPTTYRRNLVKAAALILAEIERLDRAAAPTLLGVADGDAA